VQINRQIAFDTWQKCGNVSLAAKELGTSTTNLRARLRSYYKHHGLDLRHLDKQHQIEVISSKCKYRYKNLRMMIHQQCYILGVGVFDVDGELLFAQPEKYGVEHLVGVYDRDSDHDDMREDLYWYVTNVMEATE